MTEGTLQDTQRDHDEDVQWACRVFRCIEKQAYRARDCALTTWSISQRMTRNPVLGLSDKHHPTEVGRAAGDGALRVVCWTSALVYLFPREKDERDKEGEETT